MSNVQEFDHSVGIMRSLLWAYNTAGNLESLLQQKQDWYDENQSDFWDNWVTDVFDLRTANNFGLSVWSVILELPLFGESNASPNTYPAFGFDNIVAPASSPIQNFNDPAVVGTAGGNFATDASGAFGISTEQKRILLRLRYYQLTTRGAIPDINRFLNYLFGPGEIYVLDAQDMSITYVLLGATTIQMLSLFELFDILPRPAGVEVNFIVSGVDAFGFADFGLNFDTGSFAE